MKIVANPFLFLGGGLANPAYQRQLQRLGLLSPSARVLVAPVETHGRASYKALDDLEIELCLVLLHETH